MNYGGHLAVGLPKLQALFADRLNTRFPGAVCDATRLIVTNGNTDAMNKIVTLLSNEGDVVFSDAITYTGWSAIATSHARVQIGVEMDEFGMVPSALAAAADAHPTGRLVYLISVGHNPCGTTIPRARRQELLAVAREKDLILLEDDAYGYLCFGEARGVGVLESFVEDDTDGRVIRFETMSKTIAPGIRLGYLLIPKLCLEKFQVYSELHTWSIDGASQELLLRLFETWGNDGFDAQVRRVQHEYESRMIKLLDAMDKHLQGICRWTRPTAGMFVWIEIPSVAHVDGFEFVEKLIRSGKGIAMVPGAPFVVGSKSLTAGRYRLSCTQLKSAAEAEEACMRLARAVELETAERGFAPPRR
jgi:DNA-binding transcriptional MocR family regulator